MWFFRRHETAGQDRQEATRSPELLAPELLARIKTIQLRTQRLVTDALAGEYHSAFKGRGMEFEQVREYTPGDDIRHIDWNVTARMSSPFVKEHREERELTVMLIVDVSSSGAFGTARKQKREVVAEVAAVLAYLAIQNNDRVGMIIFSDRIEHFIPPKKGRSHVWRVIREVLSFRPTGRGTDLDGALDYLGRVVPRRSVGFVISDFLDEGFSERLRVAARRHDPGPRPARGQPAANGACRTRGRGDRGDDRHRHGEPPGGGELRRSGPRGSGEAVRTVSSRRRR